LIVEVEADGHGEAGANVCREHSNVEGCDGAYKISWKTLKRVKIKKKME